MDGRVLSEESRRLAQEWVRRDDIRAAEGRCIVELLVSDGSLTKVIVHEHLAMPERVAGVEETSEVLLERAREAGRAEEPK